MGEEGGVSLRFRHTLGDIGPFQVDTGASIANVKDELFSRWPAGARVSRQQQKLQRLEQL